MELPNTKASECKTCLRNIESFRLEKTFKIIEPHCNPNTAKSTTNTQIINYRSIFVSIVDT